MQLSQNSVCYILLQEPHDLVKNLRLQLKTAQKRLHKLEKELDSIKKAKHLAEDQVKSTPS